MKGKIISTHTGAAVIYKATGLRVLAIQNFLVAIKPSASCMSIACIFKFLLFTLSSNISIVGSEFNIMLQPSSNSQVLEGQTVPFIITRSPNPINVIYTVTVGAAQGGLKSGELIIRYISICLAMMKY